MGEGENCLKYNLPWFQLLGTNLSWQAEYTEFVYAAECVAQSTCKWGKNMNSCLPLNNWASRSALQFLMPDKSTQR